MKLGQRLALVMAHVTATNYTPYKYSLNLYSKPMWCNIDADRTNGMGKNKTTRYTSAASSLNHQSKVRRLIKTCWMTVLTCCMNCGVLNTHKHFYTKTCTVKKSKLYHTATHFSLRWNAFDDQKVGKMWTKEHTHRETVQHEHYSLKCSMKIIIEDCEI